MESGDKKATYLVLFTNTFPYGSGESFLNNEIPYLSARFDKVFIYPSSDSRKEGERKLPDNTVVKVLHQDDRLSLKIVGTYILYFIKIFFSTFIYSKKRWRYLRYFKSLLHYFSKDLSKARSIAIEIENNGLSKAVFYDYWLLNSSLSIIYLKQRRLIQGRTVARAHGFDLYDERHLEAVVPFKEFKIRNLDFVSPISKHGTAYLKEQLGDSQNNKVKTHYSGVKSSNKLPDTSDEKLIVSCSSLFPFKRVSFIAQALVSVDSSFRWVHFGDGEEMEKVNSIIQKLPSNKQVTLMGARSNQEILAFYKKNYVSLFISLSEYEGLPVSMMEAQSYGIPIIGTNVNGVSEIVTHETGILLEKDFTLDQVATSISAVLREEASFERRKIREYFEDRFSADLNYPKFITEALLNS